MTVIREVDPEHPEEGVIGEAAEIILSGGLVAFPTETVYGLGADAMNERAVLAVFEAKGRPADNPLIVHVAGREMLRAVAAEVNQKAERLIEEFWPGPLTLVFKRKAEVAAAVSAGLPTVAVRMPRNPVALELIRRSDRPIAAPSANRSGRPSPTLARHVARDLGGRIDMILDGGTTNIGIESTVLDMTSDPPMILRPGWVTREALAKSIGAVGQAHSERELQRSPGTRHRHYSPRAPVLLIENSAPEHVYRLCTETLKSGPVGFIGHTRVDINEPEFYPVILENDAGEYARSIYAALRELDDKSPRAIIVEGISDYGEGAAVMDRLRRAASQITDRTED